MFYGSIRDNVVYAREADEGELEWALKTAGAAEFVSEFENGIETMVGGRGVMLSGGQRS